MIKNYIITALRNMLKQRGYFFINVLGLAIGLTSFIFITLYVLHELSYDKFNTQYEEIYRIKITGKMSGQILDQAITAAPMAKALKADYPEVDNITRLAEFGAWLVQYEDAKYNEDGIMFADSTFFNVFDFELIRGNPDKALAKPRSMILTESYANKYFGNDDPIGKKLIVEEDTILYTVTGVLKDVPENSHFHFDMLGSMNSIRNSFNEQWVSHNYYTYLTLHKGADPKEFEKKLEEIVFKYVGPQVEQLMGINMDDFANAGNYFGYFLQPLKDIHLKSNLQEEIEPNGDIKYVYIYSIIAILILIIAIINFVNLTTAKASARAKEVGVRKVVGSTKSHLILQFISESLILAFIAMFIAVFLVELLSPSFNNLVGKELSIGLFDDKISIFLLLGMTLLVGIFAGIYPAFILAAFKPVVVLKGTLRSGAKSGWMRNLLVILQFTSSIVIVIGTLVVYNQLSYLQNKNLGFNKEQLMVVRRPDALDNKLETFKEELVKNSAILGTANSRSIPGKEYSNNGMMREDDPDKNLVLLFQNWVSFEYPELLGLELVEGRFFSKEFGTDSLAILINESAVKLLGYDDPIGKIILQPGGEQYIQRPIIGVVKDYHVESLHKKIAPACLAIMPGNWEGYLCIRVKTENIKSTLEFVENKWNEYVINQPFQYFFFDEEFNSLYKSERKTSQVFLVFALLAIFIACLGLLGLIAYSAAVRTKEIGVRKVLGATIPSIVTLLSKEVIKMILISTIFAWPIAYFATKYWLENYANRIEVSPFLYISATIIALLIGWFTVLYQAIKSAIANPVDSLKYE